MTTNDRSAAERLARGLEQHNHENRELDGESDAVSREELREQRAAIERDPELRTMSDRIYEDDVDQGGETTDGRRTGPDEAWSARPGEA